MRLGRGGGRPVRKQARSRRRLPANPFVEMEAEERGDKESGSESESSPLNAAAHSSDIDTSDSSYLDDSFVGGDDCFD